MTPNLMEIRAFRRVNLDRVANGLPKYKWAPFWMIRNAREHSRTMANKQELFHVDPSLPNYWLAWGQNVGEGPTVGDIHDAFMASPHHRPNILDSGFKRVAIGVVVDSNGMRWETQNFIQP